MDEERNIDSFNAHSTTQYGVFMHPDLARHFTDFEDVIDSLRLAWQGQDIDYTSNPPQLRDFGKPIMNELGISKFVTLARPSSVTVNESNLSP